MPREHRSDARFAPLDLLGDAHVSAEPHAFNNARRRAATPANSRLKQAEQGLRVARWEVGRLAEIGL